MVFIVVTIVVMVVTMINPQRIRTLPEIDGLSKDTVLTSWMAKYDAITKGEIVSHLCEVALGVTFGDGQARCHNQTKTTQNTSTRTHIK